MHACASGWKAEAGAAVGGGLALALASAVRIAAEGARFGAVFILVGLSACDVGVSHFLPRIVGVGRAAELMLTGRHFDAEEAERIGMLHAVVPEAELLERALAKAREIAANSEYGVWMTKRGLWTRRACATRSSSRTASRCSAPSPATWSRRVTPSRRSTRRAGGRSSERASDGARHMPCWGVSAHLRHLPDGSVRTGQRQLAGCGSP